MRERGIKREIEEECFTLVFQVTSLSQWGRGAGGGGGSGGGGGGGGRTIRYGVSSNLYTLTTKTMLFTMHQNRQNVCFSAKIESSQVH